MRCSKTFLITSTRSQCIQLSVTFYLLALINQGVQKVFYRPFASRGMVHSQEPMRWLVQHSHKTSDLTLPELYLHAEHDCAWSRFHTNFHFLMLGKHERHPSAASTTPLRGTLPHQNPSVTFRTLVPPIYHLEVSVLYSPRGFSQYYYSLGILGASAMDLPG